MSRWQLKCPTSLGKYWLHRVIAGRETIKQYMISAWYTVGTEHMLFPIWFKMCALSLKDRRKDVTMSILSIFRNLAWVQKGLRSIDLWVIVISSEVLISFAKCLKKGVHFLLWLSLCNQHFFFRMLCVPFVIMSLDHLCKICACVLSFLDLIVGAFGTGKVAVYRYVVGGTQIFFFWHIILY